MRSAFVATTPCPATQKNSLPCPGYQVDHIVALCSGGVDHPGNMQWLSIIDHQEKTRDDIQRCRKK
mgnify:FL=1